MADSIQNKKNDQSYLRMVQEQKAQKKRDLMIQKQQDITELRQYYSDQEKKIESDSADAVNHIKAEQNERLNQQRAESLQQKEELHQLQIQEREAMRNASNRNGNAEASSVYNRQGQKQTLQASSASTKNDDFYKVHDRGSRLSETNQGYVIDAYAPATEKDNLKVSVQRNKAVVSGQRKFGGQVQDDHQKLETHNFQTFREEFNFDRPVSHEGMTRERIGDYVRFTIPKLENVKNPEES